MKHILLFFGMIISALGMAGTVDTIPATDNLIEYTGRIDFWDPAAPKFSYSGVSIRACFTGTSIGVIMNDDTGNNYYNIILDGKLIDTLKINTGKELYQLASGLENKIHEIEIFKRTELTFGKTQFFGFVVDNGETLTAIANPRTKLIEFIGNSITCGYGNEGVNGGTFGPTTENHYMTYAAITSRNFNARHLAVCLSGIGIYRNYDGPAAGNTDNMTNYYTRVFLYDENPKYSFADQPDLVCIDLGTNDFSTSGGDSAKYVSNYFRLIDTIQKKYVMPDIVCLLGPMMSGATLSTVRKYLQFIADSATNKGKGNVYFFEMSAQTGDLGIGIDYHPTVAQHIRNGMELTEYIKSLKSWKVSPAILSSTLTEPKHIQIEFNANLVDLTGNFSGFSVTGNGQDYTLDSVYRGSDNKRLVHVILQQGMSVGEKVTVSYTPGTIESEDTVLLSSINEIVVKNNLAETKITKGYTSNDGKKVTLVCSKNIKKNSTIVGLTLTNNQNAVVIDSFSISNASLLIYPHEPVFKADTIFVSYSGSDIYGIDELPLSHFSNLEIKNNSNNVPSAIKVNQLALVAVYPNPNSTGIFHYRLDISYAQENAKLEVINSKGYVVYTQIIREAEGNVDLTRKLSQGVYFFRFTLDNEVITKSILAK